jgi:putative redox protein
MTLQPDRLSDSAVTARPTGKGRFQAEIALRGGSIFADEPLEVGGDGTGPTPYELLAAALASCTAMTLKLYAERKGWTLPPFTVEAAHSIVSGKAGGTPPRDLFTRAIHIEGPTSADQQARLIEIADKCPVHRTLMRGFEIVTHIGRNAAHPAGEPVGQHVRDLEAACAD